jgi:hypothetical protein
MNSLAKFNREVDGWQWPTKDYALAMGRRIVACVNACRGTTTSGLEDGPTYSDLWNEIQTIRKSVDDDGTHGGPSVLVDEALEAKADALRERDEARAMVAELAAKLKALEYSDSLDDAEHEFCPECGNSDPAKNGRGHFSDCTIPKLLAKASTL